MKPSLRTKLDSLAKRLEELNRLLSAENAARDMDEFRNQLARRILMFINAWHGCPEPPCRRHQGCMAPSGQCTNLPPVSAEEMERDWPQARAEIYTALQERLAAHREAAT